MTEKYLLDTNVFSYYLRDCNPELNRKINSIGLHNFCWSPIVWFEIYSGAFRKLRKNPKDQRMLKTLELVDKLSSISRVIPLTLEDSKRAAQMIQFAESCGLSKGNADMLIAAQAINNGCTLVSNDLSAFQDFEFPGLKWVNWM